MAAERPPGKRSCDGAFAACGEKPVEVLDSDSGRPPKPASFAIVRPNAVDVNRRNGQIHLISRRAALTSAVAASGVMAGCASAPNPGAADDLAVVDSFLSAYAARDIAAMLSMLADDIYFEDPTFHLKAVGKEEARQFVEPLPALYSEVRITPFNRIHASPWVISQQRISAVLRREDGSTRNMDVQGVSMFEVRGRVIARWYDYYDVLEFQKQAK
jgi:limonene-1,2-epoxide hydrolase